MRNKTGKEAFKILKAREKHIKMQILVLKLKVYHGVGCIKVFVPY